jgi:hypothetical protein
MPVTKSEIKKLEILAIKDTEGGGEVKMVILPHSTQVGLKYSPQPLVVTGPFYAESRSEFSGPVKYKQAVTMLSDLTVSGTLYAERIVVEVDESVTGSLWVSGSLLVSQSASIRKGLEVNTAQGSGEGPGGDDFIVFGAAQGREIISALASSDQVLFLSAGPNPDEKEYADMAFFVSGTVDSRGTTDKGTALFGGDLHISGNLTVDGNSPGGGSGSPGGSDTQVQYNNATNFGGVAGVTSDGTSMTFNDTGILIGDKIIHDGDSDTYLRFAQSNMANITVGGKSLFDGTTTQMLILSGGGVTSYDETTGADVAFYVSGSTDSLGTPTRGTAIFGGDVVISGSLSTRGGTVINEAGSSTADFRVESGNEPQAIYLNASSDTLHINKGKIAFETKIWSNNDNALEINSSGVVINEGGHSANDFRVESDNKEHALFVDSGTDQTLILSGGGVTSPDESTYADMSVFVSGSIGSRGSTEKGTTVFGGDVAISGSLIAHGDNTNAPHGTISGSIHETSDGLSYLVAGSSVTITSASNGQVTIASTGAASDSFKTISVSGQSDVIADSSTDTLTLAEGSNITITTDAGNDTITFASAGGGGGGSGDYQAKNANFTVGTSEYMFGIDSSQGHLTGTLPAAASAGSGKQYTFKDSGGYAGNTSKGIHIATDSNSEKIDNADAANILVNSGSITVMTDGNDWFVIGVS